MTHIQSVLRQLVRVVPLFTLAVMLSACGSTSSIQTDTHAAKSQHRFLLQASQDEFENLVKRVDAKSKILDQYADWKGVRYRLGGSNKRGVDCSGFVQITFREQFGLELPRSTTAQQSTGELVNKSRLRPGDLVLFRAGSTGKHVGIYIGGDNFVHASTTKGVIISSMNDSYWKKRYRQARRVLEREIS